MDTPEQTPDEPRTLRRSRSDRVIGGVCAGVARYLNLDPLTVRIAAVALTRPEATAHLAGGGTSEPGPRGRR